MKKYYFIFLVLVIILALSACGNSNGSEEILQEDNQVYEEPEDKGMSLEEARQLYEGGGHAFFVKEKDKDSYCPVEEINLYNRTTEMKWMTLGYSNLSLSNNFFRFFFVYLFIYIDR